MPEAITLQYRIRWSDKTLLDWERFAPAEEAYSSAAQTVRVGESYSVEKFDSDYVRCRQMRHELRENTQRVVK